MQPAIALFASSRRNGNTGQLIDRIATDLQIEVIDLAENSISAYDYDHRNRGDAFEPLMTHVLEFDSIIFASPVYWYAVSPPMKTFIDRISDLLDVPELLDQGRRLRGKTGYVVCTSIYDEPPRSFVEAFKETFRYLGMDFGGHVHANCENGYVAERYEKEVRAFVHGVRERGSRRSLATE